MYVAIYQQNKLKQRITHLYDNILKLKDKIIEEHSHTFSFENGSVM